MYAEREINVDTSSDEYKAWTENGVRNSDGKLYYRRVETLSFVAQGFTSPEIAQALGISPGTVRVTYRKGAYKALGVNDAVEAAVWCLNKGVITYELIVPDDYAKKLKTLTVTEQDVLDDTTAIYNDSTAKEVFYTPRTIKFHYANINRKLGARSVAHAKIMHIAYGMKLAAQKKAI